MLPPSVGIANGDRIHVGLTAPEAVVRCAAAEAGRRYQPGRHYEASPHFRWHQSASIHGALVDLLGKPIAESNALCIPTAVYAMSGGAGMAWQLINGRVPTPLCELGWKSLGVLELTALPSIDQEHWVPMVQEIDALLVGGGDPLYLCYWMRESGLADLLPSLREAVYVGVSAGSMVMAPNVGEDFVRWKPPTGNDETLGLVDFAMFPHLDNENMPGQFHGRRRKMGRQRAGAGVHD